MRFRPNQMARLVHVVVRAARAIAGIPDYERYLNHVQVSHPGTRPLSRDQYAENRMMARYERPGSRCC